MPNAKEPLIAIDRRRAKFNVLKSISMLKEILFAPCTSEQAMKVKGQAWDQVLDSAKREQLVTFTNDWKYMRDGLFNVWKDHTLSKIASIKTPGPPVGKSENIKKKLNETDLLMMDILCTIATKQCPFHYEKLDDVENEESDSDYEDCEEYVEVAPRVWKKVSNGKMYALNENYMSLKEKLDLEILYRELYIRKMMVTKLEKETGVKYSNEKLPKQKRMMLRVKHHRQ